MLPFASGSARRSRYGRPILVATLLLTSCTGVLGPGTRRFGEERTYLRPLFETPESCEAAQPPDFHINCTQWVTFWPGGRVELVLTDIINPGRYGIRGSEITLHMESSPEVPATLEFRLSSDERTMTDSRTGAVWIRDSATDVW